MTRLLATFGFLAVVAWAISGAGGDPVVVEEPDRNDPIDAPGVARDVAVYGGVGTWVDIFDFDPATAGPNPPVTPASVETMAALGVDTLYLQAANDTDEEPDVVEPELLGEFLVRAHEEGVRVVGWYLPRLGDVERDLAFVDAIADFEADGHRFDGIALDMEWTGTVDDAELRSLALVDLSQRARAALGEDALGAIVLEPVLVEDVNPNLWPDFPYADVAEAADVLLPMSYWTNRTEESGFRQGFAYTDENLRRLRAVVGDDYPIHAIGGVADAATVTDYVGFAAAATDHGVTGVSVYDFHTTASSAWAELGAPS